MVDSVGHEISSFSRLRCHCWRSLGAFDGRLLRTGSQRLGAQRGQLQCRSGALEKSHLVLDVYGQVGLEKGGTRELLFGKLNAFKDVQ